MYYILKKKINVPFTPTSSRIHYLKHLINLLYIPLFPLYYFGRAAITNYHRLDDLHNSLEVQGWSVSWLHSLWGLSLWLTGVRLLLYSLMVFPLCAAIPSISLCSLPRACQCWKRLNISNVHNWIPLSYSRNYHNILNQLYFNKTLKMERKKEEYLSY